MDFSFYHLGYIDREIALAVCPDLTCRRSGRCGRAESELPCLKTHESLDDFRYRLADKINRLIIELGGTPAKPGEERPLTYEGELRLAELKQALWQRDHDYTMKEMAAKQRAERKRKKSRSRG